MSRSFGPENQRKLLELSLLHWSPKIWESRNLVWMVVFGVYLWGNLSYTSLDNLTEEFISGKITRQEIFEKRGEQIKELADEFHDFNDVHKHLDFENDLIISNWDFIQENGEWKIEGMIMKRLKQCLTRYFYWRWRQRLRSSIIFDRDFTSTVLRWDYSIDFIMAMIVFNLWIWML